MVETARVELASKNVSGRLSPSAAACCGFARLSPIRQTQGYAIPWILLRYRELTQEVPALLTPDSRAAGDPRPTRGLNYAAIAKLLSVLAFLLNGYFLRGSPPRLAYLRSTHLSKPFRPHNVCASRAELCSHCEIVV